VKSPAVRSSSPAIRPAGTAENASPIFSTPSRVFFRSKWNATTTLTVLYNRSHLISAEIFDNEAGLDPDYAVASRRPVSILLSNGRRIDAFVRVARPAGRDRLSDWTRQPEVFRYVEFGTSILIVNADHIVAFTEVPGP